MKIVFQIARKATAKTRGVQRAMFRMLSSAVGTWSSPPRTSSRLKNSAANIHQLYNKHFESSQKLRKDGIGIWENYIKLYAVYWYWYTVHARSLINYVLSLSIPNFQNEYT